MMMFRKIKKNINDILVLNSNNTFQVVGYQKQTQSAEDTEGLKRLVQVFYSFSDLPQSGGSLFGPVKHDITYRIELTVSAATKIDLSIISDENASEQERAIALDTMLEASGVADELIDELYEIVYQILMASVNIDMGIDVGEVSNRWIGQMQKDNPVQNGSLVVLTGSMFLKLTASEELTGLNPVGNADIISITIDQKDDDTEQTAIQIQN